jgi:CcmD family protein
MKFLYLAYAATWTIHLAYMRYLSSRSRRLRNEARDLEKD